MQLGVVSLWSLLEACREGSDDELAQAAAASAEALAAGATLTLLDSVLLVDDRPAVNGVDSFAAAHGLIAFLSEACIARVEFAPGVSSDDLVRWAGHVVALDAPQLWPAGVRGTSRRENVDSGRSAPVERASIAAAQPDSRLRSVFLQHRLIAGLPAIDGVDPATAKLVVQQVVDRLMSIPGGLEPLMLLQQDEALLQRSTAVAVLTVLFARRCGWPAERLADLGAAGLLHDLGAILDPEEPGPAAFRWLLERGADDFWLRSALVARRWRDGTRAVQGQAGTLAIVSLVRLAVARGSGRDADELVAQGAASAEMLELARGALACA